jgi:putative addiction module component (TIGR02574 family)
MSPEQLEKEVLAMPATDRARLADHMLASLETSGQIEIEQAWGVEAEDRIKGLESGELSTASEEEVNQEIAAKFPLK